MPSAHSICAACAALLMAAAASSSAQVVLPVPQPEPAGGMSYTVFLRGQPIGTEQIAVARTADGWNIVSAGRLAAPIDAVARRVQVRYTADWHPIELTFDGT